MRFGSAGSSTAEATLVVPIFMVLVLAVLQFAMWAHGAHVVQAAAAKGDQAAQAYGADPESGTQASWAFLNQNANGLVGDLRVSESTISGDQSVVTVTGRAESILPFLSLPVSAKSIGPVQEFRVSG